MPSQNVRYVRDFVQQYSHFFDQSFAVLVERQMRVVGDKGPEDVPMAPFTPDASLVCRPR